MTQIDQLSVNTLRVHAIEAVDQANSGHPGLPLGAAPMAWALWAYEMNHTSQNPAWLNRDRFVLSAGHGSALLYALLHLFDYGISGEDLAQFRQLGSKTPGHPEYREVPGVETTTGPLGAGISTAVGMAMAEARLAAMVNKEDLDLIDHYTFVLCGDGDLMEGVSGEASSLAGTLGLNKLIVLYDSNHITIEGKTDLAFTEDARKRYEAYGWQTLLVEDGNDLEAIREAIKEAKAEKDRPSFIEIKTQIGFASPLEGEASVHGSPLGRERTEITKKNLAYPDLAPFEVAPEVKDHMEEILAQKKAAYEAWLEKEAAYKEKYPQDYARLEAQMSLDKKDLAFMDQEAYWKRVDKDMATRASSHQVLQRISKEIPYLFGGSADLGPSNKSTMDDKDSFSKTTREGANIHFGVREHAMGAIINGIYLHGGFYSYGATFLVFSDYLKPQLRLSALMHLPVTYIFTHDSIGVGEDGPTHQPVDQLTMLRAIPNFVTFRPADSMEVLAGWYVSMHAKYSPLALILSRQTLPELAGSSKEAIRGGYILEKEKTDLDLILMASGSEVALALEAKKSLEEEGYGVRLVSMPSMELFDAQSCKYKNTVLPKSCRKRLALEAGNSLAWHRWLGLEGQVLSMDEFGASGPAKEVFDHFGFSLENVVKKAKDLLKD
ncbi:MAG: transketolase [Tissierellia bacterium]|nr:transketolase [Tissierellia bacterium]